LESYIERSEDIQLLTVADVFIKCHHKDFTDQVTVIIKQTNTFRTVAILYFQHLNKTNLHMTSNLLGYDAV
jgi:hypothetical protein